MKDWAKTYFDNKEELIRKYKKADLVRKFQVELHALKIDGLLDKLGIGNKNSITIEQSNNMMKELILKREAFLVARFGNAELSMMDAFFKKNIFNDYNSYNFSRKQLCNSAGFFPNDERIIDQYCLEMLEWCREVDLLGTWKIEMEEFFASNFCGDHRETKLSNLEPYYFNGEPWTTALKGKKVLVIHPFDETIRYQYSRRNLVWGERTDSILPEFELHTLKAVQTIAKQEDTRFKDWFEALQYMVEQMGREEFDVAIVGCGAYGLPLAAEIKKMGRGAIHMGGATQILFGIRGKRWDNHPVISKMYNENWISPLEEKPKGFENVEDGCYW